ncbi:MAG: hypothetical protein WCL44_14425, partial [bacterium]
MRDGVPRLYRQNVPPPEVLYGKGSADDAPKSDGGCAVRPRRSRTWSLVRYFCGRIEGMFTPRNPAAADYWESRIRGLVQHDWPATVLDLGGGDGRCRSWLAGDRDTYVILEPDPDAYFVNSRRGTVKMITFFTTAKPFEGATRVRQINAIRSWQAVHPDVEVMLFGNGMGYSEIAAELGVAGSRKVYHSGNPKVYHP